MSEVTNIMLHCSYGEDYLELRERDVGFDLSRRRYKGVEMINRWLNAPGRELGELCFVNSYAGGHQTFTGALFIGAFNYLDVEGLAEQVKGFGWEEPKKVQLFVKEEEDDTFWEYDLGIETEGQSDEDK